MDIERHKLTAEHLLNTYKEEDEMKEEKLDENERVVLQDLTMDNIICYDPNHSYAERFMDKQVSVICTACSMKLLNDFTNVDEHCATKDHYENVKENLKKKKKREIKQKKKEEKIPIKNNEDDSKANEEDEKGHKEQEDSGMKEEVDDENNEETNGKEEENEEEEDPVDMKNDYDCSEGVELME